MPSLQRPSIESAHAPDTSVLSSRKAAPDSAPSSAALANAHAPAAITLPPEALARVRAVLARRGHGTRTMIGLVGEPGAGKSTVAAALSAALGDELALAVVPMDGFHLANAELARLGRAASKGAPDTFDAAGYLALLHRLRNAPLADNDEGTPIVYAPAFHREIEEAVAGEIPVLPDTRLVITEGNYLLLEGPEWRGIRDLLDDIWFVATPQDQRHAQLLARHIAHGRSREAALDWIAHTDEPNARRIAASVQAAQASGVDIFVLPV